ncbi:MAG: hypothetical protein GWM92_21330 [Gemmatimonadetes bacterium]|nr:HupE/UreJ family protein [Gemmatimonadota bacterium]NIR81399.1 HupE/UreJ family protein [Gemmatimonadota bacterium]NIT90234.1 HupE/UreJ family protein [Gemmatimonadota bacterium]NIU34062.1 HupE/UreJ family protein [Gemmatimonadota bacterium]NIU38219.1 hypothetical protein [Gemmatimonadota bacterium]
MMRPPRAPISRSASLLSPVLLAGTLLLLFPVRPAAHEVPADVAVRAWLKAEATTLRLLVRAPLEAMRDVEFPLRGPGYLEVSEATDELRAAARLWIADFVELWADDEPLGGGRVVAARVSRPSSRAFESWDSALAHVRGEPLADDVDLPWQQALLDVLIEYPAPADTAALAVEPRWAHLGLETLTVFNVVTPDGAVRRFHFHGNPGRVRLDPGWHHAALRFVEMGFLHILDGIDHLLFLLCLVIPIRRLWPLVAVVTAFTVAHSITLIAAALGTAPDALWFPPLIETLIAASIVWMALENVVGAGLGHRWAVAFGFGLVHGFGFSFLLRDSLQLAGTHLWTALLSFNVGVEAGQLLVVAAVVPALVLLFRHVVAQRVGAILISALVAHEAWHWMTERGGELLRHRVRAPTLGAAFWAAAMRWAILALVVAGAAWGIREAIRRLVPREGEGEGAPVGEGGAPARAGD